MLNEYTVGDFCQDLRIRLGDTAQTIPSSAIIGYLNTALRRLGRIDGMAPLFAHRDTFDLASINKDGTPSVAWDLGKIGAIIDIEKLRILQTTGSRVVELTPTYKSPRDFYDCNPVPEQNAPGTPSLYTIERYGGSVTRLLLDRPPKNLVSMDLWYSAFHPRIASVEEDLQIPYAYCDVLETMCMIFNDMETTDESTARALYEDLDLATTELAEMLARRTKTEPYRRVRGAF